MSFTDICAYLNHINLIFSLQFEGNPIYFVMAKAAHSTQFRRVDVDALDEDRFEDDAAADEGGSGPSDGEIQELLNSKNHTEALLKLLRSAPISGNAKDKDRAFGLVLRVLLQYKASEVDAAVKQLSQEDQDVLMKYLYRGFAEPTDNACASLLTWHEKLTAVAGLGSIMRVMTDRKTV